MSTRSRDGATGDREQGFKLRSFVYGDCHSEALVKLLRGFCLPGRNECLKRKTRGPEHEISCLQPKSSGIN